MIVIFGAVGVDIVTNVTRIPRPGETMMSAAYNVVPGTKGANQALAAARAGSEVAHVGTCGQAPFGEVAVSLLMEENVNLSHMARSPQPTGICLVSVDESGENTVVAASAANLETNAEQLAACPFGPGDYVVVQNEVRQQETHRAIQIAKQRGASVIYNVAPAGTVPEDTLRATDVLIVNEHELEAVTHGVSIAGTDLVEISRELNARFGLCVVVTLGANGAIAWQKGELLSQRAPKVDVIDTTAAGDSFTGAFVAALDQGLSFVDALGRGIAAGSISVTRPGAQTSIPRKSEIDKMMSLIS
jgi:ribokinase